MMEKAGVQSPRRRCQVMRLASTTVIVGAMYLIALTGFLVSHSQKVVSIGLLLPETGYFASSFCCMVCIFVCMFDWSALDG